FYGQNGGDELGAALACADVTSDGIPDLIVGAPGAFGAAGEQQAGRVYVIAGRASLASTTIKVGMGGAEVEWVGPAANAALGQTLLARDLDNDGVAELLVAAPGDGAGMVHLLARGGGWPAAPTVLGAGSSPVTFAGAKVAALAAGDLDGDRTGTAAYEVILGEPSYRVPGAE